MPEYLRALVFILVMAALVFKFIASSATAVAMTKESFALRRNAWFLVTLAAFLAQNIWIYYAIVVIAVYKTAKKEVNKVALFFTLLFALPYLKAYVPGFAGINYFIEINYPRVLVWLLLLPIFWQMVAKKNVEKFEWNTADVMLVLYFSLYAALNFQYLILTEWFRYVVGWFSDVLIPYFVISRAIKDMKGFREVIMSFLVGAMVLSLIGFFEFNKQWLVYQSLGDVLDVQVATDYLIRGGNLRAIATSGQAIVLGYILAVALVFYVYIRKSIPNSKIYLAGLLLLLAGEISPLSKGPWVGAAVAIAIAIALGAKAAINLAKIVVPTSIGFGVLLFTEYGDKIIGLLPFVGTIDEGSMNYRQLIIEKSISVIANNFYFGSNDYTLYLEDLRQGQGLIDIVNNYIAVALSAGVVGLTIYLLFFIVVLTRVYIQMRKTPPPSEEHELGQVLIGAIIGLLIMLSSVSEITFVPVVYWSVCAMAIAYSKLVFSRKLKTLDYPVQV